SSAPAPTSTTPSNILSIVAWGYDTPIPAGQRRRSTITLSTSVPGRRDPSVEHRLLPEPHRARRGGEAQVRPGLSGGHPAPGRARDHARPHQERLAHLLDGGGFLTDGDGQRRDSDRSAAEAAGQRREHRAVES